MAGRNLVLNALCRAIMVSFMAVDCAILVACGGSGTATTAEPTTSARQAASAQVAPAGGIGALTVCPKAIGGLFTPVVSAAPNTTTCSTLPTNIDGHTAIQQAALAQRPGVLASLLGKPRSLLVGLGTVDVAPMQTQGLTPDIYDQYLAGAGAGDWTTWNSPAGAYITTVAQHADQLGAVPMFTLYQMATIGDGVLTDLSSTAFMTRYWSNVRLMFQMIGAYGKLVLVNFEPDFWGYTQRVNADPTQMFAHVKLDSDCANQPNSVAGTAACLVQTARQYAPNAYVGFPPSLWGDLLDTGVAYFQRLGARQADFVLAQTLDRDAGCVEAGYAPAGCNRVGSGW